MAYSRYDAGDLLDGVSNEALKFLYKVMKLLPRSGFNIINVINNCTAIVLVDWENYKQLVIKAWCVCEQKPLAE